MLVATFRGRARPFLHKSSLPFFQPHSRETTEGGYPSLCNCLKDDYGGLSEEAPRAQHHHSVTLKPVRVSGRIETCVPVSASDPAAVCPAQLSHLGVVLVVR